MAIAATYETSATISTVEYSLPKNLAYNTVSGIADDAVVQAYIDLSAMVAGDQFDLKVYERVQSAGTQRLLYTASYVGVQAQPHVVLPSLLLMHNWDITLKRIAGADRTIAWSIREIT